MSGAPARALRIHLGLVLAEAICVSAFVVEILRALGGNALSWAYVFEWPLFGGYAIYMWHGLLRQEREGPSPPAAGAPEAEADARLAAWNQYLHDVHQGPGPDRS